ncbi:expressed unknown protein [Seminavis robusta]|uniref:Uncharacterized protein n=1 Tax=Seminavis robusta TaxID=568900 RepID=A0A9N8D680_9STRA|nr:expressed unknown protein [Seminavis robusta]|eukprot:Sro16_g011600.1 n/a (614) ;mRNA; f:46053-48002
MRQSIVPAAAAILWLCVGSHAFTTPARTVVTRLVPQPHVVPLRHATVSLTMASNSNPVLSLYERYQDKLPSDAIVEACAGQRVVASDLAAKAGISVSQAARELTLLASLSQGDIAVGDAGELLYSFPSDLKGVLQKRSSQYQFQQQIQKAWPTVFWGIRVGFGVALVASLVAIYSTIFFINSSSSSDNDDRNSERRGGGGFGGGFGYFWGPSPFDFLYYRPYGSYGYYGRASSEKEEELGFLESVFSYVFGDGDPNAKIEEERLQLAAQMIRDNKGAVTAEQLAPYCDPDITPQQAQKANYVDESFVLPIVTQLNGEPTVTDDGDIVYLFPELQTTASKTAITKSTTDDQEQSNALILKRAGLSPNASTRDIQLMLNYNGISTRNAYDKQALLDILEQALPPLTRQEQEKLEQQAAQQDPSLLTEREIPFSVATDFNKIAAGALGVVNLGGALYLGTQLAQITAAGYSLPGMYGAVAGAFPLLLGYALLYNAIPLVRNFWINQQNAQISARNSLRKQWKTALAESVNTALFKRKLKAAKAMGVKQKRVGSNNVIFDTSKTTLEELGKQKEQAELSAFDSLLEKDNDNDNKKKKEKKASLDSSGGGGDDVGAFE